MKHYGNIDLNRNLLQNAVLPTDTNFPTNPLPGMIIFKNKKMYFCAEIAGGLPVWVPMTQEIDSVIHDQTVANTAWTITHNLNSSNVFVQIYDQDNRWILPDYIDVSVFNQVTVMFSAAQAGKAVIMLGSMNGAAKDMIAFSQAFTNSDTWVIAHGLGYNPEIAVYIGGQQVQPTSITHDSTLQTTIVFSSPQTGTVRCI